MIQVVSNERNRICLFRALFLIVRKTCLKLFETIQLLVKYLNDSNSEYIMSYIDELLAKARSNIDGTVWQSLAQKLSVEDLKYSKGILGILLRKEENIGSLLSNSDFDFGLFLEKLFSLSLSKSYTSVLATDLILIFKNHHLLSYYMNNLSEVLNNHPLELLYLIKESCDYICLSALKTRSVYFKLLNIRFVV